MERITVIKMNVCIQNVILFQAIPILATDVPFKHWQKNIFKFVWQRKKHEFNIKYYKMQRKEENRFITYESVFYWLLFMCC